MEYNEYVGELWPATEHGMTEVRVRYGVRDDQYLDWSITAFERVGSHDDLKQAKGPLPRLKLMVVDVSDSAIRRHVYDPNNPHRPPQTTRLIELGSGDYARVNSEYQHQLTDMCVSWQRMHPEQVANPDRHNTAFIGFMAKDRDVHFREGESFGWVRNTVVCIDADLADMVITDRAYFHFPTSASTAGVLLPDGVMKFIWTSPGRKVPPEQHVSASRDTSNDGPMTAQGDVTMGMLVASIYAGDWTENIDDLLDGE